MKKGLVTMAMLATAMGLYANVLSFDDACNRAFRTPEGKAKMKSAAGLQLARTWTANDRPTLYIVNTEDGFVILSADDSGAPVLGYSDEGNFSEQNMPPALGYMLDMYSAEIEHASDAGLVYTETPHKAKASLKEVAPLINTQWSQSEPYNLLCPQFGGERSVTGCVATAMVQIMKYHQWPSTCNGGTVNYESSPAPEYTVKLSLDFNNLKFDWSKMLDKYTGKEPEENNMAVAKLMQACGYSVSMQYTPYASSAYTNDIGPALNQYFDYNSKMQAAKRQYYSLEGWNDLVYRQLEQGLPVLYGGTSVSSGHEFICDGYANEMFHINWGWGGLSDGYYKLSALDPESQGTGGGSSGYFYDNEALINISKPNVEIDGAREYLLYSFGSFYTSGMGDDPQPGDSQTVKLGQSAIFFPNQTTGVWNVSCQTANGNVGIICIDKEGTEYTSFGYPLSILSGYYMYQLNIEIPYDLPEGEYIVKPIFMSDVDYNYQEVRCPIGTYGYLKMTVSGNTAVLTVPENVENGVSKIVGDDNTGLEVRADNATISVKCGEPVRTVTLYSADGKKLMTETIEGLNQFEIRNPGVSGYCVVTVTTEKGKTVSRQTVMK